MVIGSKLHRGSQIAYPLRRRILSLGYYALVRALFRLPVHDTQTGLKLYRRDVLELVVPRLLVKRFAHDLEALVNAHRLGFRIVEVPVVVTQERPFPRIGLGDAVRIAVDTAAIFYRTYVLRYYDRVGASLGRVVEVGPTAAERELGPPAGAGDRAADELGGDAQHRPHRRGLARDLAKAARVELEVGHRADRLAQRVEVRVADVGQEPLGGLRRHAAATA